MDNSEVIKGYNEEYNELKILIEDLIRQNENNKKKIDNIMKMLSILEKIEVSIQNKANDKINELEKINKGIDENIQIFKKICINTK